MRIFSWITNRNEVSPLPCALPFSSRECCSFWDQTHQHSISTEWPQSSGNSTNTPFLFKSHAASHALNLCTQLFSSAPAFYLREGISLWGETEMGRISSINLICLLDPFQPSQSRSKIPVSMSSILKLSKNTLPKGSQCFDLQNTIIISLDRSQQEVHVLLHRSKYSVSGQGRLSTV